MISSVRVEASAGATAIVAVIYARYSSENQRDASIDDQCRLCEAAIAREEWRAGPLFIDRAMSGSSARRPGYQALLDGVRRREFSVIVAESLDRLSRDQEHVAALFKRCKFAGIRIYTTADGWVSELHVGLKGTMGALALVDLAAKTRRGLRGRVETGASAGGLAYGYDVVPVKEGEDRGGRTINIAEAETVRRIFADYAEGLSPKKIAAMLNDEGVVGPRAGKWSQSTINGNRKRGTGIVNNELYAGFLVWNRLRYEKDPETGRRRSQLNPESEWLRKKVPHLRIIDQSLWDAVRHRQAALDAKAKPAADGSRFQSQRRAKYLLSGLLTCGVCEGGVSVISATHLGCSNARNKGDSVCGNRRTIKRSVVEATVLDALRTQLMAPEIYKSFVAGFTAEWNKEQASRDAAQAGKRDELKRIERKVANLVDAIADNGGSEGLQAGLRQAEARRAELRSELAVAEAPAPRLMPNLAEGYRIKVSVLQEALEGDDAGAVREQIRALIDEIRLIPCPADPKAPLTIEVRGHLAAMLALGSGKDASAGEQMAKQFKLVAGAGFEPAAFRL